MSDEVTTVSALKARAIEFRDARDWGQFHQPKDLALAVAVEAGELAELFLWKSPSEIRDALGAEQYRQLVADEVADVLIYLLYLAEATGMDLSESVVAKLRRNEIKYPLELARGSARKYTDL